MEKVPATTAQDTEKSTEGGGQMPAWLPPAFQLSASSTAKSAGSGPLKLSSKGKATVIAPQAAAYKKVGDARAKTNAVGHFSENAELDLVEDNGLGKDTHYFVYGEFTYAGGGRGKEYVFVDASQVKLATPPSQTLNLSAYNPYAASEQPPAKVAVAAPAVATPAQTWRGSGKLRGNPPVRTETPFNTNVVEDEDHYKMLLNIARTSLKSITAAAGKMNPTGKDVLDHRFWFARVYQYVTEGVIEFTENRSFYYPSYVLLSVIYFEKMYRDNLEKGASNAEAHWQEAFSRADGDNDDWVSFFHEAVFNLVDSMIAHIRFDLPRAVAWIYNSHYRSMAGVKITDFKADFMSMGPIFDKAGLRMNDVINQNNTIFRYAIASWLPSMLQEWGMSYVLEADMSAERADTWKRAELLEEGGLNTDDPYTIQNGAISGDITATDHRKNIGKLPGGLAPQMNEEAESMSDNEVRGRVDGLTDAELAALPTSERMRMLFGLMSYYTGNDDEAAIYRILHNSRKDLVDLVNAAGAWRIAFVTDFSDYDKLRNLFVQRYYAHIAPTTAGGIIKKCADGETANWEETMIIDVLQAWESSAQLPLIVEMTGAEHLLDNVDGDNYTEARRILRAGYYPKMSTTTAFNLIFSALDENSTEEYQEEMIMDILEAHPRGRSIVVRIGEEKLGSSYSESDHFDRGIDELKGTLDGGDQDRLEALFGV